MTVAPDPNAARARRQFQVHRCLGRGGFGEVYEATMTSTTGLRTAVALKVLRGDTAPDSQAMQRLKDEGRILARINHPTILKVHDLVLIEGRVTLITEYVDGQDLSDCLKAQMPLRAQLEVLSQVSSALHAAWTTPTSNGPMSLVHRDIKPSNIRVSRHGEAKLLDFGIARTDAVDREARTQTDMMVGTPQYMSPERFLDTRLEPGADVFALGCVLHEGLTGTRLFELSVPIMASLAVSQDRHEKHVQKGLAALPPSVDPAIRELVARMLAYEPKDRPSHAEVMALAETLADDAPGPGLARWCSERVWGEAKPIQGVWEGRTLSEGMSVVTRSATEVAVATPTQSRQDAATVVAPAPRRRWVAVAGGLGLLAAAAIAVVAVGAGGVGIGMLASISGTGANTDSVAQGDGTEAKPAPVSPPVDPKPEPAAQPAPAAPVPEPEPEPAPPPPPRPKPATPKPAVAAANPEPAPAPKLEVVPVPVPAPPPAVKVPVANNAGIPVELRRGAKAVALPASVEAGSWEIWAEFSGELKKAGSAAISEGTNPGVTCNRNFLTCKAG